MFFHTLECGHGRELKCTCHCLGYKLVTVHQLHLGVVGTWSLANRTILCAVSEDVVDIFM